MALNFAKRMEYMKASEIRELLKVTENTSMISFAGGTPAPELFPVQEIREVSRLVLKEEGAQSLQYSTTEGYAPLRCKIADRMNKGFKTNLTAENILITSGSQQGLDFSGKVFLNEGDAVLCEKPMYLAAIGAFRAYLPEFIEVESDAKGMIISDLERKLVENPHIKLAYVVPDFQNPTGTSWSLERRREFMKVISRYDVAVIEDNPYSELRFEGEAVPSMKSMDEKGQVISLGTFSKTFCPGMRVGWAAAEPEVLEKYILVKQGADLHTSSISQRQISRYIDMYDYDANIERIKDAYRKRRDVMIRTMEKEFPAGVSFTRPEGGLFLWVELPDYMDSRKVLEKSLERDVAFVPGGAFFPNKRKENTMRLNYSNMPEDRIVEGVKRLSEVIRSFGRS